MTARSRGSDSTAIRWRFGSIDSEAQPPIVLENLPVCGNCHSFSGDGKVLGLDIDYGNDKGGYAVLPVSSQMVMRSSPFGPFGGGSGTRS